MSINWKFYTRVRLHHLVSLINVSVCKQKFVSVQIKLFCNRIEKDKNKVNSQVSNVDSLAASGSGIL